ncbi:MAG TPA: hypothetical protein VFO16_24510 [Pseudonocardiaceae bacterium]|nr:hypothetical protein [Pseudonocardiaceae bacterium]
MSFASGNSIVSDMGDIEIASCPMCALPAFVESWFHLESTDGPLEHVRASCVNGHSTVQLAERVGDPGSGGAPVATAAASAR